MPFPRKILSRLYHWQTSPNRKPLILRGARQVGKSTLIQEFGKGYQHFVSLNLERPSDRKYFSKERDVKDIWEQIRFEKNIPNEPTKTLLFIDEIQEIPFVIRQLRYFYEDMPDLHLIAAGSLLEFALGEVKSFPVGRIEEMTLHPLDFEEFLTAINEVSLSEQLRNIPFQAYAYDKLFEYFKKYVIIGGMPEVVKTYVEQGRDMTSLRPIYASIWETYKSDVVKYAKNDTEAKVLRHIMASAPFIRDRISFSGFGTSNYRSREVGEAFRALDLAKIMYLIYPTTQTNLPAIPNLTRKPRLQFLDTGLLNYASEIQAELIGLDDLNDYHRGFAIQHIVSQEIMANMMHTAYRLLFWVREKSNSNSEVDMVYKWKNMLIPIEVKSGTKGGLRSLHEYMDTCEHTFAIRFLQNKISMETCITRNGKEFHLLNLPYFAATQLDACLEHMFGR